MEGNSKTQKDKNKIYGKKGDYAILGKIGEGTFSEVIKVQNEKDGSMWACKRMKQRFDKVEDIQRIREIQVELVREWKFYCCGSGIVLVFVPPNE